MTSYLNGKYTSQKKNLFEKPHAYSKGYSEFYKLTFTVTPDVLIPRPETELLIDEVLRQLPIHSPLTIIDLGTGSGNIAISLSKNSNVKIIAIDISKKALRVALRNAKKHDVEKKITFIQSNLLTNKSIKKCVYPPFFIVANLPYVPSSRIHTLDASVRDFEPHRALDGGNDGFDLYRKLFSQIKKKKIFPEMLLAEIDDTQSEIAKKEIRKYFPNAKIDIKQDLTGRTRFMYISLKILTHLKP